MPGELLIWSTGYSRAVADYRRTLFFDSKTFKPAPGLVTPKEGEPQLTDWEKTLVTVGRFDTVCLVQSITQQVLTRDWYLGRRVRETPQQCPTAKLVGQELQLSHVQEWYPTRE